MERFAGIRRCILIIPLLGLLCCCSLSISDSPELKTVSIIFDSGKFSLKSADPEEEKISDINLLVFDIFGRLEEHILLDESNGSRCSIELMGGKAYRFVACANFGYKIPVKNFKDLESLRYHLAYPDEYTQGIPMFADSGLLSENMTDTVTLELVRLMSKISIRIDRRRLSEDVEMHIAGIRIGNCPKSASVLYPNASRSCDDCFTLGFNKTGEECRALNTYDLKGISHSLDLYMLENLQGRYADGPLRDDYEKVFDEDDPRRDICSYIEIDIDYTSPEKISSGGFLKYRFYLGGSRDDLDIERNCHYSITICPEDDGLKGDGWRVDKTAIHSNLPPSFSYYPQEYINGDIGDTVHIGCIFTPSYAPFDIGLEYMEQDKSEGIYDYVIDEDGHGAVLTFTGPGRGMIYMSAGPPVNESALWVIEVNLPSD